MSYVPAGLAYTPIGTPYTPIGTPYTSIGSSYARTPVTLTSQPMSGNQDLVQTITPPQPIIKTVVNKVGKRYSKLINIYGDIGFTNSDLSLDDILIEDKGYSFLKNVLRERDLEIQEELQNAVQFYNDRFGVDLSKFKSTDGYWTLGEHRFYPYQKTGNYIGVEIETGGCCPAVTKMCLEGGFVLAVGAPGLVGRGTYGKETGENIPPGSIIFFGYYILVDENSNGSIYHFRSNTPSRTSVEVPLTWNLDVYDYRGNIWGKAIGSAIVDKKNIGLERNIPVLASSQSYVPSITTVNTPIGVRQVQSVTTIRNNEPLPLIVNTIPIASSNNTELMTANVSVPSFAPMIRQELVNYQEITNVSAVLISRNIITF